MNQTGGWSYRIYPVGTVRGEAIGVGVYRGAIRIAIKAVDNISDCALTFGSPEEARRIARELQRAAREIEAASGIVRRRK